MHVHHQIMGVWKLFYNKVQSEKCMRMWRAKTWLSFVKCICSVNVCIFFRGHYSIVGTLEMPVTL